MSWVLDSAFSIHNTTASLQYDKYLYVGNEDFEIRVWNTQTSTLFRKLPPDRLKQSGHTGKITGFAYSSRYDLLFSCGYDGSIITWHGTTMVHRYQHFKNKSKHVQTPSPIYSIYFNEENEILVIGLDGEIVTFELSPTIMSQLVANGDSCPFTLRQTARIHHDIIHKLAGFQRRLFSCSYDHTVATTQLMDLTVSKTVAKLPTTPSALYAEMSQQSFVVGDLTGSIKIYSVEGLYLGSVAENLAGGVHSIYMDNAMQLIWVASKDGNIHIIDQHHQNYDISENFQMFKDLPVAGSSKANFEVILGDGLNTRVTAIVNHKYVYSWKWSNSAYLFRYKMRDKGVSAFSGFIFSDDMIPSPVTTNKKRTVSVQTITTKRLNNSMVALGLNVFVGGSSIFALRQASSYLYQSDILLSVADASCFEFCYPELCLLAGFKNGNLMSICLSEIRNITAVHTENARISIILVHNSKAITFAGDELSMAYWDCQDKLEKILQRERIHDNPITAAVIIKNTSEMYTCDTKGFMRQWQVSKNDIKEVLLIDHSQFGSISFCVLSQMEDMIICSSSDGYIRGWHTSNVLGAATFVFSTSPCYVTALAPAAFNTILIASDDKTIRLISLNTREEKAIFVGHNDLIVGIYSTPRSDRWVSIQWDGELFFWSQVKPAESGTVSSTVRETATPMVTSRLPKLYTGRSAEQIAQNALQQQQAMLSQSQNSEQIISIYEKNRKALLLKRRDQERQARAERRTPQYHQILQLTNIVQKVIKDYETEKAKSSLN